MKTKYIFWVIVLIILTITIGLDYLKMKFIESNHSYTIAYVTDYKHFAKSVNNRIEYYYTINGVRHESKYRDSNLNPNLKGKRIVIKVSKTFASWNIPLFEEIVQDTIQPPANGWEVLPNLNLAFPSIYPETKKDSIP